MSQQYVGIDLRRRRSVIVRTNAAGTVLGEARIENDPLELAAEIAKAGPAPAAGPDITGIEDPAFAVRIHLIAPTARRKRSRSFISLTPQPPQTNRCASSSSWR